MRALVLSLACLGVPLAAAAFIPGWTEQQELLVWLPALVPAFLLSYYRGWHGASLALAAGMATVALVQVEIFVLDLVAPQWSVVLSILLLLVTVAIGSGWVGELLHRERELENQLLRAQKFEAVGRLAGGVAHDFNNVLTVILGQTEMALSDLTGDEPMAETLREIQTAGERAFRLTQQLLAFSRKQIIKPTVFDVNDVVRSMDMMMRQLLGEDVAVTSRVSSKALPVLADRGEFEQVFANLLLNARDAMPVGGELVVETTTVTLDRAFARTHPGSAEGDFVLLTVKDNGKGMTDEVVTHVFEPFYTTTAPGEASGLGLAAVYGIIKKAGGYIEIDSTPGEGTTFGIHLPAVEAESTDPKVETQVTAE